MTWGDGQDYERHHATEKSAQAVTIATRYNKERKVLSADAVQQLERLVDAWGKQVAPLMIEEKRAFKAALVASAAAATPARARRPTAALAAS